MDVAFAFDPALGAYDLGPSHPLQPARVLRTVSLIDAYGLRAESGPLRTVPIRPATDAELLRVHDAAYLEVVKRASVTGELWPPDRGVGPGDTPAFKDMHDASALVCGATIAAMDAVSSGRFERAFSPAGGLHHAHRDRAAGFCVYNDCAVAIAAARAADPSLRVVYLDIDAHHGDGVQEAFYEEPSVLTISLHEDGRYLYPGTGSFRERGRGSGEGFAINVPLPPYATPACYTLAFDDVAAPAIGAFGPDLIVAQCGADAHWSDPLTNLGMTLNGFESMYRRIVGLADVVCEGRVVACGGGGYSWAYTVPRAWTLLASNLTEVRLPESLPEGALSEVTDARPPASLHDDEPPALPQEMHDDVLRDTRFVLEKLHELGVARK